MTDPSRSSASTRSASGQASSTWCSIRISVVEPDARSARNRANSAAAPSGSRFAVGSSRTRHPGDGASTPASARRCCCPPESRFGSSSLESRQPGLGDDLRDPRPHRRQRPAPVLQPERDLVLDALHHELALRVLEHDPDPRRECGRRVRPRLHSSTTRDPSAMTGSRAGRDPRPRGRTCSCRSPTARRRAGRRPAAPRPSRASGQIWPPRVRDGEVGRDDPGRRRGGQSGNPSSTPARRSDRVSTTVPPATMTIAETAMATPRTIWTVVSMVG